MITKRISPYALLCGIIIVLTAVALLGLVALGIVYWWFIRAYCKCNKTL